MTTTWTKNDFDVFTIDGLDPRMEALTTLIRPKFYSLGEQFSAYFSAKLGDEFFAHVAKHARRTVNPPKDSWVAFAPYKRGYKALPHFQIGLFDTHLFINVAVIYEAPTKKEIAERLLNNIELITDLPSNYYISGDHMSPEGHQISEESATKLLTRFRDVKKGEFLVGINVLAEDATKITDFEAFTEDIFEHLLPIYKAMFA